jgi:hypothetical protein
MFAPTELFAYFRPDALTRTGSWPFFDFRDWREMMVWLPPLPEGAAYVERFTSLTVTMPLPWIVDVWVAVWLCATAWRSKTDAQWIVAAASFVAAAAMIVFTVTTVAITNRYLADFYPLSVVGFALGAGVVLPMIRRHPIAAVAAGIVAGLLTLWSIAVTLALNYRVLFD